MPHHQPRILIQPLKPAVIAGIAQKLPVLIRVQAPDAAPTERKARKPYHLALVIDRSGSMSGAPLIEAVRCTRHIIEQLAPTDMASLVIFDDRVQTLVAAQPVGDRQALHLALSRVHGGGSTNLHGGWKAGADGLLPAAGQAALARVILLSDGNANVGEITDTTAIAALCAHAAERGVTTSTYGLGPHFNEDLMVEMAKRGGGNHYYGDTASRPLRAFRRGVRFHLGPLRPPGPPVARGSAAGPHPPAQRLSAAKRCGFSGRSICRTSPSVPKPGRWSNWSCRRRSPPMAPDRCCRRPSPPRPRKASRPPLPMRH
jgi:hypothetical protein